MTKLHPTENDVKAEVKKQLDFYGWYHFSVPGTGFGKNGVSDRIAVKAGRFLAIEVKYQKGEGQPPKGTPLQEKFLRDVRDHGGYAWVVSNRNIEEFKVWLQAHS